MTEKIDLQQASEEDLIIAARERADGSTIYLEELYERNYGKVAYWCLRFCGNKQEAADLAQEVFLRVHTRLDTFRMGSRFSTWLYTVARSVAINRGISNRRRKSTVLPVEQVPEAADPDADPEGELTLSIARQEVRDAVTSVLDPLEAKILYLHFVDGMSLPAITALMELPNKSGAKAFVVSGIRKLRRRMSHKATHTNQEKRR